MTRKYSILAVCIAYCCCLQAQPFIELFKLSQSRSSANAFSDTVGPTSRIQESNADLTVPFKLQERVALLSGITYERIESRLFADAENKILSSFCLKLGANLKLNDRYSATIVLLPKYAGEASNNSKQNYQVGVMAFLKRKIHDRLNYRYGFYYNQERFGPFVVPIFGLYYLSLNKKFETTLMLPIQADASYEVLRKIRLGMNYNGQVRSYHFTELNKSPHPLYLQKISNELYAYLKWQVTEQISISARMGQSLGRKYKVFQEGDKVSFGMPLFYVGDQRKQLNTNFKDGLLYQIVLVCRVPIK